MYSPYKSETECVLFRAKAIWADHWQQCIVWTIPYLLFAYGTIYVVPLGKDVQEQIRFLFVFLVAYPLLIELFPWIDRTIHGKKKSWNELFKSKFAHRAITINGAICVRLLIISFIRHIVDPPLLEQFGEQVCATTIFPILHVLLFLLTQWGVDYLCILLAQTGGTLPTIYLVQNWFTNMGKIIILESKLIFKTLWIPYLVYFLTKDLARLYLSETAYTIIYQFFMQIAFLGFGFVYYPLSAISRSILLMQQSFDEDVVRDPVDFSEIDAQYIAWQQAEAAVENEFVDQEDTQDRNTNV